MLEHRTTQEKKAKNDLAKSDDYRKWIVSIKSRVQSAQLKAAVSVNRGLLQLYWFIGGQIIELQETANWGSGLLKQMDDAIVPQAVAQFEGADFRPLFEIPWGHNRVLLDKLDGPTDALFYVQKTIEHNWSRSVLTHQIESGLHLREGKAVNNFQATLPAPESDLTEQLLRYPHNFDFLTLTKRHNEKELEEGLLDHLTKFLLELGAGFAFVGNELKIHVDGDEFKIDLLFYHLRLHCYVVIELKVDKFKPEYAGKLDFYVSAVDSQVRTDPGAPTIGILICK